MRRDTIMKFNQFHNSSFLSCEKDTEAILKKLFISSKPYADYLKKLLIINEKDCLTTEDPKKTIYQEIIDKKSLSDMISEGYFKIVPKLRMSEHEEVRAYIIISFDNFTTNAENPFYRDCTVTFDVICHTDYWEMNDYQIRPLKIAGYIDGILNESKLSGIGTFNFLNCSELILDENLSGYTLSYRAIHGNDDNLLPKED